MKVKAVISFSGILSMAAGEVRDLPNGDMLQDLLRAGYVLEESPTEQPAKKAVKKREAKRTAG